MQDVSELSITHGEKFKMESVNQRYMQKLDGVSEKVYVNRYKFNAKVKFS